MSNAQIEPLEQRQLLSTVAVNLAATEQTMRGIGANFDKTARNPGAPLTDSVMDYLLANTNPTIARVPIDLLGWEPQQDSTDPNVINWSKFQDTGNQHKQFLQLQSFAQRGMTIITSIFDAPNWLVTDPGDKQQRNVDPSMYPFMAQGIGAWLIRLRDTYGVTVSDVSINESNAGYDLSFPASKTEAFIAVAGPMFAKMGLGYVKWDIGDDGFVGDGNFIKPVLEDQAIAPYVGEVEWHTWNLAAFPDSAFTQMASDVTKMGKEIWATETGFNALEFETDPAEFATWSNALQYAEIYVRSMTVVHVTELDYWEFASDFPLISPTLQPYPNYYVIKSYMDNIAPGSQVVQATSSDSSILSVAVKDQKNDKFFAQAVDTNTSGTQSVTYSGLPNVPLTLTRSDATDSATVVGTFTPVGGKLTLSLPASSVNNLVGPLTSTKASAPVVSISAPTTSTTYTAGGTISFAGSASETSALPKSDLSWSIEFHHNGIADPPVAFNSVSSGTFTVPSANQRAAGQFYRVILTATDSNGLTTTGSVDVMPKIASVTMASNVPGLFVQLDGLSETTNSVVSEIAGAHTIAAPLIQLLHGHQYEFQSWSDGGARTHNVTNSGAATYTAKYVDITGTSQAGFFLSPTADAYVGDGTNANTNFGTAAQLTVKNSSTVGQTRITYLTFNISGVNKAIGNAYLRMFGSYSGIDDAPTAVFGVSNTTWSETAITFNNRPAPDAAAQDTIPLGDSTPRWYQWTLTSYVAAAEAAGKISVSFALIQPAGASTDTFNSREATSNGPELVISQSGMTSPTPPPPPPPMSTTTTLKPVADAYVNDGSSANTNFGKATELLAKNNKSAGLNRRVYIQFDISKLTSISSANLILNGMLSSTQATNLTADIFDVSSQSWSESTIDWNNKPSFTNTVLATVTVANTTAKNYTIDLTKYLQAKKKAGATKITLMLEAATSTAPVIEFASRESATGPQLVIAS